MRLSVLCGLLTMTPCLLTRATGTFNKFLHLLTQINTMKKFIIPLIFIFPVLASAQDAPSKKEFRSLAGLSVIGGVQNNNHFDAWAPLYGIEFSMECPLVQTGKSKIRQQLSLIFQDGKDYKSLSLEVNPQYKIIAGSSFEWGAGPVAGFIFTTIRDNNKPVFNYGLGTGVVYYFKKVFIGFESRYTMTKEILFDDIDKETGYNESGDLNNLRVFLKIGCKLYK